MGQFKPEKVVKEIMTSLDRYFKKMHRHVYQLQVIYNKYGSVFGFYLLDRAPHQRTRSTPLYIINSNDLKQLESVINLLQTKTKISLVYVGFEGERWPSTSRFIQKPSKHTDSTDLPF